MNSSVSHTTGDPFMHDQTQEHYTSPIVDAMFIFLSVIGILGNSLVIVVLARMKELRTITNILIINQSFADLASAILLLFRFIPMIATHLNTPTLDIPVCIFIKEGLLFWTGMTASTYNLVLITLDRYFAVVHPTRYKTLASYKRAVFTACVPWLIGLLIMSPEYTTLRVKAGGDCIYNLNLTGRIMNVISGMVFAYLLPVGCMLVAYIRIFTSLKTKVGTVQTVSGMQGNTLRCVDISSNSGNVQNVRSVSNNISARDNTDVPSPSNEPFEKPTNKVNTLRVRSIRTTDDEGVIAQPAYRDRARKNIIITLLIVSLTFFLCWTPSVTVFLIDFFHGNASLHESLSYTAEIIACCNIYLNPFIYTRKYRRFRKGLNKLFHKGV